MARDKTDKSDTTPAATPATTATTTILTAPVSYGEAVGIAKQFLTEERHDEAGRDLYSWAEYEDAIRARIAPLFSGSIMIGDLRGTKTEIIDFASSFDLSDPVHYEVCCEMLAGKIQAGEPIPPDFRDFAAALIRGQAKRPKRKPGEKGTGHLHSRIAFAVQLLVEHGLTATRGGDNDASGQSACDAVAEALCQLKLKPLTFSGVKRIWLEQCDLVRVMRQLH